MTQEIRLQNKVFREIRKVSLCNTEIDKSIFNIDRIASTVLFDESNEVIGKIIGVESDCSYSPVEGCGCHIDSLVYISNLPTFSLGELIQSFTYGVLYGLHQTDDCVQYKYNYLWFEVDDTSYSSLLRFYGNNLKEVFSKEHIHVYVYQFR